MSSSHILISKRLHIRVSEHTHTTSIDTLLRKEKKEMTTMRGRLFSPKQHQHQPRGRRKAALLGGLSRDTLITLGLFLFSLILFALPNVLLREQPRTTYPRRVGTETYYQSSRSNKRVWRRSTKEIAKGGRGLRRRRPLDERLLRAAAVKNLVVVAVEAVAAVVVVRTIASKEPRMEGYTDECITSPNQM